MRKTGNAKMTTDADKVDSQYYQAGETWEKDVHRSLRRSRTAAWIVTAFMIAIALLSLGTLFLLLPLKQFEPYMVVVDKTTGFTEISRSLRQSQLTTTERDALTTANLVRYIKARETYDPTNIKANYELAQLLSTATPSADLVKAYSPSNPRSLDKIYGRTTRVSVNIKSVSLLNASTASVRFSTETKKDNSSQINHWVGILKFRYTSVPMRNDWRFDNPLGFQVIEYRRDQETPGAATGQEG